MNDFSQKRWKKNRESYILGHFVDAYKEIAGTSFIDIEECERPDFTCKRENGEKLGIELVKITRGKQDIFWDSVLKGLVYMDSENALNLLQEHTIRKDNKRRETDWTLSDSTLLLIELVDIPLAEIYRSLTKKDIPDLLINGFLEIWIIDTTGMEAFNNVEIFCVKPEKFHGYYSRGIQKPYA